MPRDRHGNPYVSRASDCDPVRVLWQDDTALVVAKPSGMLVHNAAFAGRPEYTLIQAIRELQPPQDPTTPDKLHAVHRLDRGTSGTVLLATQAEWTAPWQQALAEGQRHYLAVVRGHLQQPVDIDHPVKDDRGERKPAQSRFVPLAHSTVERCCLVRVELTTGRYHQVRQHAGHISHPLIGDSEYGKGQLNRHFAATWGLARLALHGLWLHSRHPATGEPWEITAPLPADLTEPLAKLGLWPVDVTATPVFAPPMADVAAASTLLVASSV